MEGIKFKEDLSNLVNNSNLPLHFIVGELEVLKTALIMQGIINGIEESERSAREGRNEGSPETHGEVRVAAD